VNSGVETTIGIMNKRQSSLITTTGDKMSTISSWICDQGILLPITHSITDQHRYKVNLYVISGFVPEEDGFLYKATKLNQAIGQNSSGMEDKCVDTAIFTLGNRRFQTNSSAVVPNSCGDLQFGSFAKVGLVSFLVGSWENSFRTLVEFATGYYTSDEIKSTNYISGSLLTRVYPKNFPREPNNKKNQDSTNHSPDMPECFELLQHLTDPSSHMSRGVTTIQDVKRKSAKSCSSQAQGPNNEWISRFSGRNILLLRNPLESLHLFWIQRQLDLVPVAQRGPKPGTISKAAYKKYTDNLYKGFTSFASDMIGTGLSVIWLSDIILLARKDNVFHDVNESACRLRKECSSYYSQSETSS